MIIDEMIYIINVGDSRAIMSIDAGAQIGVLSRDHKPDDELQFYLMLAEVKRQDALKGIDIKNYMPEFYKHIEPYYVEM